MPEHTPNTHGNVQSHWPSLEMRALGGWGKAGCCWQAPSTPDSKTTCVRAAATAPGACGTSASAAKSASSPRGEPTDSSSAQLLCRRNVQAFRISAGVPHRRLAIAAKAVVATTGCSLAASSQRQAMYSGESSCAKTPNLQPAAASIVKGTCERLLSYCKEIRALNEYQRSGQKFSCMNATGARIPNAMYHFLKQGTASCNNDAC